jgi:hypothetical protein
MKLCNNIIGTKENMNMSKKIYEFLSREGSKWEADVQISQKGETKEIGQTMYFSVPIYAMSIGCPHSTSLVPLATVIWRFCDGGQVATIVYK